MSILYEIASAFLLIALSATLLSVSGALLGLTLLLFDLLRDKK